MRRGAYECLDERSSLRTALWRPARDTSGGYLVCDCKRLGIVAVLAFRIVPTTNVNVLGSMLQAPAFLVGLFAANTLLPIAALTLLLLLAAAQDRHTLYLSIDHPSLPEWLRPRPFSISQELLKTVRVRTTVLRIFHVYRGA